MQVEDLSRYGTFVNGVLVGKGQSAALRHGDQLALVSPSAADGILYRVELVDRSALLAAPAPTPADYLPPPPHIGRRPSGGSVAGSVTSCGSWCDPSFSWPAELMGEHTGATPPHAAPPHAAPLPLGMLGAQPPMHGLPTAAALPGYRGGPGAPPQPSQQYANPGQASQQYVSASAATGRAPPPGPPPGCAPGVPATMGGVPATVPPAPLPPPAPPPQSAVPWTLTPPTAYGAAPGASHYPPPAMPPLPLGGSGAAEGAEAPQGGSTLRRPPRAPGSAGAAGVAPPPRDVSQEEAWLRLHAMQLEASRGSAHAASSEDERRARKPVPAPLHAKRPSARYSLPTNHRPPPTTRHSPSTTPYPPPTSRLTRCSRVSTPSSARSPPRARGRSDR